MSSSPITISAARQVELRSAAREAAQQAYAPYSGFRVGAALLLESGDIVCAANVENTSYGLALCAERSAVARAVAQHGPRIRIAAVAVDNLDDKPCSPCGACRQVLVGVHAARWRGTLSLRRIPTSLHDSPICFHSASSWHMPNNPTAALDTTSIIRRKRDGHALTR